MVATSLTLCDFELVLPLLAEAGLEENVALSVEAAEDGGACGENEGDQDEGAQIQAAPPSSENKEITVPAFFRRGKLDILNTTPVPNNLKFQHAVVLNAVRRRNERERAQTQVRKGAQKSAKPQNSAKQHKNCTQPGLKQPGLGNPKTKTFDMA